VSVMYSLAAVAGMPQQKEIENVPKLTDGRQHVGLEQGFQRELFVAGL